MWRSGLVVGLAIMATGCAGLMTETDVTVQRSSWYAPKPPVVVVRQGPDRGGKSDGEKPAAKEDKPKAPVMMTGALTPIEQLIPVTEGRKFQKALCVPPSDAFDKDTRDQIMNFKRAFATSDSNVVGQIATDGDLQNLRQAQQRAPDCAKAGLRNGFEVGLINRLEREGNSIHGLINKALQSRTLNDAGIPPLSMPAGSVVIDEATRKAIAHLAGKYQLSTGSEITRGFYEKLNPAR